MSRRQVARQFAAFLPGTVSRQLLAGETPVPGQPRSFMAATLFSDISGFTNMSEELASDGPRGAEELNRVLLTTFTAMIDVIHEMGGAVSHFYGDAMSIYFPEMDDSTAADNAAVRALACAQLMQTLMQTSYGRAVTNRPPGKDPVFPLTIKIGAGYGRCQEIIVGDLETDCEFVLTGTAVDEAAAAEKTANAGEVVASRTVLEKAKLAVGGERPFQALTENVAVPAPRPLLAWSAYADEALAKLVSQTSPFIPQAIVRRLSRDNVGELAEHRPVTSIFVDFDFVEDDTDSSDIETAVMARQLQDYYQWAVKIVGRFGGRNARVNRILTGDKGNQLHIIFGAPVAPDAPEQAMRCALTMIREKPPYIRAQQIGLAAGKVFAGPVGSERRREYTVVGDVVNVSARLAQVCKRDCILTNARTAERVKAWIEFDVLEPVALKGRQETVVPYRPAGERSRVTQLQVYFNYGERPLIGRESELDLLLGGMDTALQNIGGVAAIIGAVGVGKTRLLAEGIRHWLNAGGTGLVGVAQQHTSDIPYGPWLSIWRDFFNLRGDMSQTVQAEQVAAQTRALLPDVGDDVALWGDVLGLPIAGQEKLVNLTAEVRLNRFYVLVRRCFKAYSHFTPLLIVVEDAHWADQSSLALLDEVTKSLDSQRIFFVVTFRLLADLTMEVLNRPSCVPILLTDLSPALARELLANLVGTDHLPLAVEQHLGLRDRDGRDSPVSPLFLEESINVMMGTGVLEVNGRVKVHEERLRSLQIPDTIHGLLLARLDRLPPAERDLLQVAAVIGRQFALNPLKDILGDMPPQVVAELLGELSSEDITRLVTTDPEWIYLFQHALTHEVAYESLPFSRRQELHALVAVWLEERYGDNLKPLHTTLAYHYGRAGNHEKGLHYALRAADDALAMFANEEAVKWYTQAESHLQALGEEEERWETAVGLYLSRAEALRWIGNFTQAIDDANHVIRILREQDDIEQTANAVNLLAELKCRQAQYDEALTLTNKVIDKWSDAISIDQLARANLFAGIAAGFMGNHETGLAYCRTAEHLCEQTGNTDRLARVLDTIAFIYFSQKKLTLALSAMQRSVDLSRDVSIPTNIASSLSNIALIQLQLGKAEEALATLDDAILQIREISPNYLARFLGNRAEVLSYLGRFSDAGDNFNESLHLFGLMNDEQGLLEVYLTQGFEYHAMLENWQEAHLAYERAQKITESHPGKFPQEEARLSIGLAQLALQTGQIDNASAYLDKAKAIIYERGYIWWTPVLGYFQGLVYLARSNRTKAEAEFLSALEQVEQGGNPDYRPLILLQLMKLAQQKEQAARYLQMCRKTLRYRGRFMDRKRISEETAKLGW